MSDDMQRLLVSLEARFDKYEKDFLKARQTTDRQFRAIEERAKQSAHRMEQSLRGSVANINGLLATIGVGISLNEIARLADHYTRFTNQLKVAGLQGKALADTQNKLFAIAQKYGVQLEAVGTLYGRNAVAAKELGMTQAQQLRVVEATSAALKVNGTSSQEASGALLQLSQMLGGTVVQAQEYNSLLDGARPLLQAVANGSTKWAGSVAALTQDVKKGKVTVTEFMQALLRGSKALIDQARGMPLTISASMTTLQNAFAKYIGELNASIGLTATFSRIVNTLAGHVGSVVDAAGAAAAVLLSRYVPALARAATAQAAVVATNPFLALAAAIGAATFALSAFGDDIKPIQGDLATIGDYSAVIWTDIKQGVLEAAGVVSTTFVDAINMISQALTGTQTSFESVWSFAKEVINRLIGAVTLLRDDVAIAFGKLPAAVAEQVVNAMNAMIAGVESGLNMVVHAVNATVEATNSVGEHVGVTLGTIPEVQLDRIKNAYAGAGAEAGKAYSDALQNAKRDFVGEGLGQLRRQANEHAKTRAKGAAAGAPDQPADINVPLAGAAAASTHSGGGRQNSFARALEQIKERTAALRAETAARRDATGSVEEQNAAIEKAKIETDLLQAAQRAGVQITPELKQRISELAQAYVDASTEAQRLAKSQEEAKRTADEFKGMAQNATASFLKDLIHGKDPLQSILDLLGQIADKLIDMAVQKLFENAFGGTGSSGGGIFGGLFGFLGSLFGFRDGGMIDADAHRPHLVRLAGGGHVRGPGTATSDSIPAMLSDGEFVVNAAATARHKALLEAINAGALPGFARGGVVGAGASDHVARMLRPANDNGGQVVNISAPVTVNGSSGTPEQNRDLAKQVSAQMERTFRGVVVDELRKQTRPGGALNNRGMKGIA